MKKSACCFRFLPSFVLALTLQTGMADETSSPANNQTNSQVLAGYKKMSLDELMDQEVTSVAKQPEPYRQAPAAIVVITDDDIRRSGASSIPEALRLADNLDVAQETSSKWNISARGFNSDVGNKLLVLMDGRTVYTPLLSGVIWNMQDYLLEDISRVEVISGPGGTLWGANAVNGVINITTKSAKDTQGLYVETGGGAGLQDFAAARYGGMISSNVFYRVYAKYFDQDAEDFSNGKSAGDSWNRGQGGFRIDSEAAPGNPMTLQGDVYLGNTDVATGGTGKAGGGNLIGRWTHEFADEDDMTLQLYYDRTHLVAPFPASGAIPAGPLTDDLDTADVDFQDRFHVGERNHVVWGLGYRFTQDVVQGAPTVTFEPGVLNQNLFSTFIQDEVKLLDTVFFTLGTKVEHNDYTGFEFEPSGRLQWNVTDKQMLWGAVSRAVRTPARYDRDLLEPSPAYGTFLTGNSGFQSESVVAYELGYRAQLAQKVSGSLSVFYNDYDNLRSLGLTGGTSLPLLFENDLAGDTYGLELSADYQVTHWWRLHGGYDFLNEAIHVKPGQTDLFNALNETADPQNQVFLRSSMDLPGRVELDAGGRWIDSIRNNDGGTAGTVPAYFELDVRIGWHATKNLEFSIVGQNLLHDRHAEAGFPDATQEQIVRSVYAKVAFNW